jgi:hypothetical protein
MPATYISFFENSSSTRLNVLHLKGIISPDTTTPTQGFIIGYVLLCKRKENYHLGIGCWYITESK